MKISYEEKLFSYTDTCMDTHIIKNVQIKLKTYNNEISLEIAQNRMELPYGVWKRWNVSFKAMFQGFLFLQMHVIHKISKERSPVSEDHFAFDALRLLAYSRLLSLNKQRQQHLHSG